jgi:hypothetical protein
MSTEAPRIEVTASEGQRVAQIVLIVAGVLMLGIGGIVVLNDVGSLQSYGGILLWFVGAIIIHDAIIAPVVFGIGVLMRKVGRRIPGAVLLILQAAIVVVAIMTALVVPEILKKDIGTANPTILPLDYAANLSGFYGLIVVLTVVAIVVYLLIAARRQKPRPSSSQD